MKFRTFNALCWFIHAGFFSFCLMIYWFIVPNYVGFINIPLIYEKNIVALWIIAYFEYFIICIIPILFYWIINFTLVWVLGKTLPSLLINWFFKFSGKNILPMIGKKIIFKKPEVKTLKSSNEQTISEQIDKENLDRIKEGDCFQFIQKSVIHFVFMIPFVGWVIALFYFIYTVILKKHIYFMSYNNFIGILLGKIFFIKNIINAKKKK